jgi:excisionase family DNA binding protein
MKAQCIPNPVVRAVKRLYSVKEAAVYLGRSEWAIKEMVWAGKIPRVKGDRRVMFDIYDLDAWVENNKMTFAA